MISLDDLIDEMIKYDMKEAKKELYLKNGGFKINDNHE
jgi:hypothetical protein